MDYEREYAFVIKYLNKLSIKTALIHIYENDTPTFDLGLRKIIYGTDDYTKFFEFLTSAGKSNTIYQINGFPLKFPLQKCVAICMSSGRFSKALVLTRTNQSNTCAFV